MFKRLALSALLICLAAASPAAAGTRIAGGAPAGAPAWMAAIVRPGAGPTSDRLACGGALISSRVVLTAAHCVTGAGPAGLQVVLGRTELDSTTGEQHAVVGVIQDPAYDSIFLSFDAALLLLDEPASVAPVALADGAVAPAGTHAVVRGWGVTREDGQPSSRIRQASLVVRSTRTCERRFGDYHDAAVMLCASAPDADPCSGDSGGPLTVTDAAGQERLVGLVSAGHGCRARRSITNFTRLAAPPIAQWIARRTAALETYGVR
jgi:secreted trypsin-like serine protease